MNERTIKSARFGADSDPQLQWCLVLMPTNETEVGKDHVSIHLQRVFAEPIVVHVNFVISLMGANKQALHTRKTLQLWSSTGAHGVRPGRHFSGAAFPVERLFFLGISPAE